MDEKNFDVVKVMIPESDNAFIFDVVDNTKISSSCYLLLHKDNQVFVNKIIDLMSLICNEQIDSKAINNDEFNIFMELLNKWMNSDYSYSKIPINQLDNHNIMERVSEQDYELIRSFAQFGSTPFTNKKSIRI